MKKILTILCTVILVSSCDKETVNPCQYDPCAIVAPATEVTQIETYLAANSITATKHCSGLYYIIEAAGAGTSPTICSTVSVKYKGQLLNGNIFDQSTAPVNFQLGSLIEGWKKGLILLKPGGKIKMWVPATLAYGSREIKDQGGNIVIPANSPLFFDVELVGVF
jgi:FKBP-type peptidyl-prolyl cis-trans isomerase FkpA